MNLFFASYLLFATLVSTSWPLQKYNSSAFTPPGFNVTNYIDGNSTLSSGYLFLTPSNPVNNSGTAIIVDDNGRLVWSSDVQTFIANLQVQSALFPGCYRP